MKISLNWLKDYIQIDLPVEQVAQILTDTGLEVEGFEIVESIKGGLKGVLVGKVLSKEKHPDAFRLSVTTVDIGTGDPLQIVCGAPNVEANQKVLVATIGSTLYPPNGSEFKIKKSKIRGVQSEGMICAEDELGLGNGHEGIMVLDESTAVGKLASEHFEIQSDYLIEIGLTPNRSDAMGHIGVARDLRAYLNFHQKKGLEISLPAADTQIIGNKKIKIDILDAENCPRYSGAVISGVKIEASPEWLQNRLRIIGLNPINNIVDITNYVMHETGNPLHAFDFNKLDGNIVVRKAKKGEKLITLDEVERELDEQDLMICNANEPLCIAGTYGGIDSGVKNSTTDLFVEAAYFNPVSVRKTAKRHGINSDSSFRFERGVDPNNVEFALKRAIHLIVEIAGGALESIEDIYPSTIEETSVVFSPARSKSLMGIDIADAQMMDILNLLDIHKIKNEVNEWILSVPTYRVDVTREADITEEILRIYGFNNVPIPAKLNSSIILREEGNNEKIYNMIADLLVDLGFFEIMNNSLSSSGIWDQIKTHSYSPKRDIKILNPLSNELDVMRQTLFFGGLKSIQHNQNRQHPNIKFFEFGNDYRLNEGKAEEYPQRKKLSLWVTGNKSEENWNSAKGDVDFYYIKGVVEAILVKLGIFKNPIVAALLNDIFEDGFNYAIAKKSVVDLGWIRRDILDAYDIKKDVFYASFDWSVIENICILNRITTKSLPKTQFARRDFSLLLDNSVQFHQIEEIAKSVDKKILKRIGLFDVYEGDKLPQGKKSYAVNFIFQDPENTLVDAQIDDIMSKIREKLSKELKAELR